MNTANSLAIDDLLHRICAEYTEMPGLRVTRHQAQRLWGLDAETCRHALDCLVDLKFLTLTPAGQYTRLTDGPPQKPDLRMVSAVRQERQDRQRAG